MFTQMRSQCIRKCHAPKATGIPCRHVLRARTLLAALATGAFASVASAQVAGTEPASAPSAGRIDTTQLQAEPVWCSSTFLGFLRNLWTLFGCDVGYFDQVATTPEAAMQLIIAEFDTVGTPNLAPTEAAEFKDNLSDAVCMLRQRPPALDVRVVSDFLKVATAMWIDLGGYPGDLGC